MEQKSDHELIAAYREGGDDALDILVRRHLAAVYRFLHRMVGDVQAAEDLTQEAFVKAWRRLSTFDSSRSFKAWLFAIARNTAVDYFRKRKAVVFAALEDDEMPDISAAIADERPLPDEVLERGDMAAQLESALGALPPKARSVVLLHETEEMTFQEISDATGEPLNTVKSRYRRALALLRKKLTDRLQ
ncbi:MAG TPA: sigma-70 family RNA polymerase sigma factor [Candidatus Methylomirabilis sp.]|nr:sigma-70 family RNA polymerase sigma factor [Candidatus Methylomirabilis sp.]